jgi:hypothetical protein
VFASPPIDFNKPVEKIVELKIVLKMLFRKDRPVGLALKDRWKLNQ